MSAARYARSFDATGRQAVGYLLLGMMLLLARASWGQSMFARAEAAASVPTSVAAQTGTIVGTVTDSTAGTPLPGVNVVIQGT